MLQGGALPEGGLQQGARQSTCRAPFNCRPPADDRSRSFIYVVMRVTAMCRKFRRRRSACQNADLRSRRVLPFAGPTSGAAATAL